MDKARQFASLRLPIKMKRQVTQMATIERRSLSAMLLILVEEALGRREEHRVQASVVAARNEVYGKSASKAAD